MNYFPMLFRPDLVRSMLDDRKLTTRRFPGPANTLVMLEEEDDPFGRRISPRQWNDYGFDFSRAIRRVTIAGEQDSYLEVPARKKGNRMIAMRPALSPILYNSSGGLCLWIRESFVYRDKHDRYYYKADHLTTDPYAHNGWKPGIHMPAAACRLFLHVHSFKLERIQEISHTDAIDEGIQQLLQSGSQLLENGPLYRNYMVEPELFNEGLNAKDSFRSLWIKVHGQAAWDDNHYVYAPVFRRMERPAGFLTRNSKP